VLPDRNKGSWDAEKVAPWKFEFLQIIFLVETYAKNVLSVIIGLDLLVTELDIGILASICKRLK